MVCPRCQLKVDEHQAGRETDACVAEVVMGFRHIGISLNREQKPLVPPEYTLDTHPNPLRREDGDAWWWGRDTHYLVPKYSTDIGDAWEVVKEHWPHGSASMSIHRFHSTQNIPEKRWLIEWGSVTAHGPTASLAICRAALKTPQTT